MDSEIITDRRGIRVVVLSDIHGNIQALKAVLEELERQQPDRIVICGDVAVGPFPGDVINHLMALGERARFVRGNADRELVSAYDQRLRFDPEEKNSIRLILSWCAQRIDERQRDFLASFDYQVALEISGLGSVLFCHGTPRSDEEIITSLTPEHSLVKMFSGLEEKVIVCGHTHHQFDLRAGGYRVINPGSIGMPYEGEPGAYWALLGPNTSLRRTEYAVEGVVQAALTAGYPDPAFSKTMLTPPQPDEVAAFFEKVAADRGERG